MAMRMPPQVAQQTALPAINRSSLVFFGGLVLIVLQFYWQNGSAAVGAIFHKGAGTVQFENMTDTGLQVLGLALLTLAAEYGGDNAGTAALLFLGALWLLWLLTHFGTHPLSEPAPTHTEANPQTNTNANTGAAFDTTSGGSGGQKK